MIVKLLTEHHLEFLILKESCRGSSESTIVKKAKLLKISCTGSIKLARHGYWWATARTYIESRNGCIKLGAVRVSRQQRVKVTIVNIEDLT